MEDLTIFRIFLAFPLIGLLIPDSGILLSNNPVMLPVAHIIVEATLLVSILVCSAGLVYQRRKTATIVDIA